jgi:hypothetical protein
MTQEEANAAMQAAVTANNVSPDNANVNNWSGAANSMWNTTGQTGSYSYGGNSPTAEIYAEDSNGDGIPEHFTDSNGNGTYHDPWNGETGNVGDVPLQQTGLGSTRTLTYNQ